MRRYGIILLILIATFWGCSERENPSEPTISTGRFILGFVSGGLQGGSMTEEATGRHVYVYEPTEYTSPEYWFTYTESTYYDTVEQESVTVRIDSTLVRDSVSYEMPTLYLLHGFNGNHSYYKDLFILKETLDEMISNGEIVPMVVVTPDCDNAFGGSFYVNSPVDDSLGISFAGNFEDFMTAELIDYITFNFNVDTVSAKRGIGGHSMGGYGALTLAMKHPDLYSSVSSMSAPVTFDSLVVLFDSIYAENGFDPDSLPDDTTWFYSIEPSPDRPLTSLIFAMGAAFSPHASSNPDTSLFHRVIDTNFPFGVDLPFNIDGSLNDSLWENLWLPNDPLTMLETGGYTALEGKPVYLDCGDSDDLIPNMHLQNRVFAQALESYNLDYEYIEYSGYPGVDADHITFVADRLREVLKFHSQAFSE
ncbi:MAG: hypothetical protein B6D58_09425 [candidate division Zixibacteria bacterium 4484_95]|nr:MAG: hypothetical protein B6D58_09425 [candidate division Zixibacteria bacterium 4484_95]